MISERTLERAMLLIEIRRMGMHPELASELDHYMTGVDRDPEDWPDGYTEADALEDMETRVLDAIGDGCREPWVLAIRKQLREAEIALGLTVPASYLNERYLGWTSPSAYRHKNVTYYWEGSQS